MALDATQLGERVLRLTPLLAALPQKQWVLNSSLFLLMHPIPTAPEGSHASFGDVEGKVG